MPTKSSLTLKRRQKILKTFEAEAKKQRLRFSYRRAKAIDITSRELRIPIEEAFKTWKNYHIHKSNLYIRRKYKLTIQNADLVRKLAIQKNITYQKEIDIFVRTEPFLILSWQGFRDELMQEESAGILTSETEIEIKIPSIQYNIREKYETLKNKFLDIEREIEKRTNAGRELNSPTVWRVDYAFSFFKFPHRMKDVAIWEILEEDKNAIPLSSYDYATKK